MSAAFVPGCAGGSTLTRSAFSGVTVSPRRTVGAYPASRKEPQAHLRRGFAQRQREVRHERFAGGERVTGEDAPAQSVDKRVFLVGKVTVRNEQVEKTVVETTGGVGLFGVQARAYWESIGVFPLTVTALGITALVLKLVKIKQGQWTSGENAPKRTATHKSIVTTEEEEAELHVFKCGGCGYEIYPARGREFKFFGDKFKCPCCGSPKSEFWDRNDPDDPRNNVVEDDEEDDDIDDSESGGRDGSTIPGSGPSARGVVAQKQSSSASGESPSET